MVISAESVLRPVLLYGYCGSVNSAEQRIVQEGRTAEMPKLMLARPAVSKSASMIGVANLVIWPSLDERQRRIILTAGMITVNGRIQREGEVVHLVANHLTDLSADLAGVGDQDDGLQLPHGRGDEFHHGDPGIDLRSPPPKVPKPRDIYIPALHIDSIKVKTRDFRQRIEFRSRRPPQRDPRQLRRASEAQREAGP
jgi:error-prone DNA polymerase